MKTNDQLALQVGGALERANQILQQAWNERALREEAARQLAEQLRQGTAAAEELERRANALVVDV